MKDLDLFFVNVSTLPSCNDGDDSSDGSDSSCDCFTCDGSCQCDLCDGDDSCNWG